MAANRSGRRDYNYFRDYDPATGRYIESDPIGLAGGTSTFGYVGGCPLIGTDPSGLDQSDKHYDLPATGPNATRELLNRHSPWKRMENGLMFFVHPDPESLIGLPPFRNAKSQVQCVDIVKMGYPDGILANTGTPDWIMGPKVDANTPIGAATASGWVGGKYLSLDSNNHVALYAGYTPYAFIVIDQYNPLPQISKRSMSRYPPPGQQAFRNGADLHLIYGRQK